MHSSASSDFRNAPLITPARIATEGKAAFSSLPAWAANSRLYFHHDNKVSIEFGGRSRLTRRLTLHGFALLCELTRFGGSVLPNANTLAKGGTVYVRLIHPSTPSDMVPILRLMADAGPNEEVTSLSTELSAESAVVSPSRLAKKDARAIATRNAKTEAERLIAKGEMPVSFSLAAWSANIEDLYRAIDEEAAPEGEELVDPFEHEQAAWEAPSPQTRAEPIDMRAIDAEFFSNLAKGVVDVSPETRARFEALVPNSPAFLDWHLRETLEARIRVIAARIKQRRMERVEV